MKSYGKKVEEERRKPVLFYKLMITTTLAVPWIFTMVRNM